MSDDPAQDYFADGMTDYVITGLSHIRLAVGDRAKFVLHVQGPND